MRWKIIAVNSAIVLLVGLLSYALLRGSLSDTLSNQSQLRTEAEHAQVAANGKLELDALKIERWLANVANSPASRDVYKAGTTNARQEEATEYSNRLLAEAVANPTFSQTLPTLVAVVDQDGVALGRNGTNLMRGEDVGAAHPVLKAAIAKGTTASEIWADAKTAELMSVSYAPVRDDERKVIGALLIASPLNDERLQRTSDATSGRPLVFGVVRSSSVELRARSQGVTAEALAVLSQAPVSEQILNVSRSGRGTFLATGPAPISHFFCAPINGFGEAHQAVLISMAPVSLVENLQSILWPLLGVTALGLLLVFVGGYLLGNYLTQPIEEIEEGLLTILNGKTDLRFEIEHAELGGLVFRLNSLLNQLMGVQEDDTDEEGRPSRPPVAADFSEALAVDEGSVAAVSVDASLVNALRAEPPDVYYRRLYSEYIEAKRSIGDPVDHITQASFLNRIRATEQDMLEKHGKAVRYRVEVRGREVVLLAVPLS